MHWQFLECQEMESYETYDEARHMLPIATKTSDLNGEVEYGRGKRFRIRKVFSDDDHDSCPPITPPRQRQPRSGTIRSTGNAEHVPQRKRHILQNLSDNECSPPPTPPCKNKRAYSKENRRPCPSATSCPDIEADRRTGDGKASSIQANSPPNPTIVL
ncbi:uncharacterized protein LOC135376190 [Ornithodoros turicata]|uniref:uncharacterized protein LOC135376190 n=1 Tax=Ornithodoros turicata TaxID=34597 RepID=UPI0031396B31